MWIKDGIYSFDSSRYSHVFLLVREGIIIDSGTPWAGKGILREIQNIGVDIKHILLTHADPDHIGSVNMIERETGAAVWVGKDDAGYLTCEKERPFPKNIVQKVLRIKGPKRYRPLEEWEAEAVLAIPAPGHSPGHYIFQYEDVVFSGDLFRSMNGKRRDARRSLNWDDEKAAKSRVILDNLNYNIICPSHGGALRVT